MLGHFRRLRPRYPWQQHQRRCRREERLRPPVEERFELECSGRPGSPTWSESSERSAADTYKSRPMEGERYFQPFPLELHSCFLFQLPFNTLYSSRKRIPDIAPTHTMYNECPSEEAPSASRLCRPAIPVQRRNDPMMPENESRKLATPTYLQPSRYPTRHVYLPLRTYI